MLNTVLNLYISTWGPFWDLDFDPPLCKLRVTPIKTKQTQHELLTSISDESLADNLDSLAQKTAKWLCEKAKK